MSKQATLNRDLIANTYISGEGIEIGALHNPLNIPKKTKVKYVDRMSKDDLRRQYPELDKFDLVKVDIIDDGEVLRNIGNSTQDFVIANHFLEHCQDPIKAIENMLRVLKSDGILYLAIPDKRYTFDCDRPLTTIEHLLKDYVEGPNWSKRSHFEEWVKYVDKINDESDVEVRVNYLMNMDYSIHYHVWTQLEIFDLITAIKKNLNFKFEIQCALVNEIEVVFVLRSK